MSKRQSLVGDRKNEKASKKSVLKEEFCNKLTKLGLTYNDIPGLRPSRTRILQLESNVPINICDDLFVKTVVKKRVLKKSRVDQIKESERFVFSEDVWPEPFVRPDVRSKIQRRRKMTEALIHDIELNPGHLIEVGNFVHLNTIVAGFNCVHYLRLINQEAGLPDSMDYLISTWRTWSSDNEILRDLLMRNHHFDIGAYIAIRVGSTNILDVLDWMEAVFGDMILDPTDYPGYDDFIYVTDIYEEFVLLNRKVHEIHEELRHFYDAQTDVDGYLTARFLERLRDDILHFSKIKCDTLTIVPPEQSVLDLNDACAAEFSRGDVDRIFGLLLYGDQADTRLIAGTYVWNCTQCNFDHFRTSLVNSSVVAAQRMMAAHVHYTQIWDMSCELEAVMGAATVGTVWQGFADQMFGLPSLGPIGVEANLGDDSKSFLRSLFSQFGEVTDLFLNKLEAISETMSNINVSFDFKKTMGSMFSSSIFESLGPMKDHLVEWLKSDFARSLCNHAMFYGLAYTLVRYCKMDTTSARLVLLGITMAVAGPCNIIVEGISYTWNKVIDLYMYFIEVAEVTGLVEHSIDGAKETTLKLLFSLLFGSFVGNILKEVPSGFEYVLKCFFSSSTLFEKYKKGAECTVEFMFEMVGSFLRSIGEVLSIDYLKSIGVKFPEIDEMARTVRDTVQKLKCGDLRWDVHTHKIFSDIEFRLRTFSRTFLGPSRANDIYRREVQVLLDEVKKLSERSSKGGGVSKGPRTEMTWMVNIGRSRQGKSIINEILIYDVTPRCLTELRLKGFKENKNNEVFTVHADMGDYFDTYSGHYAVRADDILQLRDAAGMPNPMVITLIHMNNTSPWFPNMSTIAEKGAVPFVSEIGFASDNNEKCSHNVLKSLNCPEAFPGRFDIKNWVCVKPEYCTMATKGLGPKDRYVDPIILINSLKGTRKGFTDMYEFFPYDWSNGKIIGAPMSYEQLRDKFVDLQKAKKGIGEHVIDFINETSNDAIKIREAELELERELNRASHFEEQVLGDLEDCPWRELPDIREVLFNNHVPRTDDEILYHVRGLMARHHPSKGGNIESFQKLTWCWNIFRDKNLLWQYDYIKNNPDADNKHMAWRFFHDIVRMKSEAIMSVEKIGEIDLIDNLVSIPKFPNIGATYEEVIYPPDWVRKYLVDKLKVRAEDVDYYFYCNHWESGTPLGDTVTAFVTWFRKCNGAFYDAVGNVCNAIIKSVFDTFTNKKFIAGTCIALTVASGSWMIWKKHFVEQDSSRQVRTGKTVKAKRSIHAKAVSHPHVLQPLAEETMLDDLDEETFTVGQSADDMMNPVKRNLYWFSTKRDSTYLGWVLFGKDVRAITTSHMWSKLEEDKYTEFWMHNSAGDYHKLVQFADVTKVYHAESLNDDDMYVKFHNFGREATDITMHFPDQNSEEDRLTRLSHFGILLAPKVERVGLDYKVTTWEQKVGLAKPLGVTSYGIASWIAGNAVCYNISTQKGMCGLPWIVTDVRSRRPFIGAMHVAGGEGTGVGICIYRDVMLKMFDALDAPVLGEETASPELPLGWAIEKEVPFEHVSSNSKMYKSVLFDAFTTSTRRPSMMHAKDGIDPWYNGRIPYGEKCETYNQDLIYDLADMVIARDISMSKHHFPWEPKIMTWQEACEGIDKFVKGIPRNTSAGYPWSKLSKKKYEFFGKDGDYEFSSEVWEKLLAKVKDDIAKAEQGTTPDWVYQQFLKDELRKISKVKGGNTRIVMGSPVDKTIVSCMYLKDFYRWLQDDRIFNSSAIGINCYGVEWLVLAYYLQGVCLPGEEKLVDGDFKNFDGCQPIEFDRGFLRVAEGYYYNSTVEDRNVRRVLVEDANNSRHLVTLGNKSYIARVQGIGPSGDASTANKNTVNNELRSLYVRTDILLRDAGFPGARDYNRDVMFDLKEVFKDLFIALGDDHILSVCEEHAHLMNQRQYGAAMARNGFVYTSAKKDEELIDGFKKLHEVTFLKRSFRKDSHYPGYMFAPLELLVILEMAYWLDVGSPPGTLADIIDIVGKELSAHGLEVYGHWGPIIQKEVLKRTNIKSMFLPGNDDADEILRVWHRSVAAYMLIKIDLA